MWLAGLVSSLLKTRWWVPALGLIFTVLSCVSWNFWCSEKRWRPFLWKCFCPQQQLPVGGHSLKAPVELTACSRVKTPPPPPRDLPTHHEWSCRKVLLLGTHLFSPAVKTLALIFPAPLFSCLNTLKSPAQQLNYSPTCGTMLFSCHEGKCKRWPALGTVPSAALVQMTSVKADHFQCFPVWSTNKS